MARTDLPQVSWSFLKLGAEWERMARRRIELSSTWPESARRGQAREACRHSCRWPEPRRQADRNSVRAESAPGAAVVEPLAPSRYKVQFTASAQLKDKLERLQALLRSEVPDGDLAAVIEKAVTEKLERLENFYLAEHDYGPKAMAAYRTG
jgi:hypothetical protein